MLLAAYAARRPTRDVDLHGLRISNDSSQVLDMVREIAAVPVDDGLRLDTDGATVEGIREDETYHGVRVTLTGGLSVARLAFHVDVNVGDPVWPLPREIELPRLLGGQISISGYPLAMVHAEKLVTAVQRGRSNSRWRDFADVYTLARRHDVDGGELATAIERVASHRQVRLVPLEEVLDGFAAMAQQRWAAWRRKRKLEGGLPVQLEELLDAVIAFADPALCGAVTDRIWRAASCRWIPKGYG